MTCTIGGCVGKVFAKKYIRMIDFSEFEVNVTALDAIRGGKKEIDSCYSGDQADGAYEVCVVYDDGSFENVVYC